MIAAPKTYPFWTKIYFSGVWLWIVEDRGGAIVHSWERWQSQDRLDFWAWHGTTGLIKAVNFGKQTFKWLVCPPKAKELKTKKIWLNLDIFPLRKYFFDLSFWHLQLWTWRSDPRVYAMQRYLVKLKFLKSEYHNWKFDQNTAKALCNYQIKRKIVSKWNQRCWTFWPITSQTLRWEVSIKNLFPKWLMATWTMSDLIKWAGDSAAKTQNFASHNTSNLSIKNPPYANMSAKNRTWLLSTLPKDFKFNNPYKKNQIDKNIIYLQYILKKHDCYSWNLTKTYSKKVIEWVSCYQLKHKLLTPEEVKNNVWWFLWPKTRDKLNEFLNW
jgi:hypothetical protein